MNSVFNFNINDSSLRIALYSSRIARVTYGDLTDRASESMIVTAPYPSSENNFAKSSETEAEYIVCTDEMRICVDKKTLSVRYESADGTLLSRERGRTLEQYEIYRETGGVFELRQTVDGVRTSKLGGRKEFVRMSNRASLTLDFTEDETLFGLGNHEEGYPSIKGHFVPLYQENMRIALPYFVSTKGYAYLFDCTSMMTFDATDEKHAKVYFDSVDAIDYYFICGGDYDGVCREYRYLTGETTMLPRWACGYIQSKEKYSTQDELISVAEKYRELKIPLDCVIQDWQYWRGGLWGDKHFDPVRYPDPYEMMRRIHELDVRVMISVWPNVTGESEDKKEFAAAGKLLSDDSVYDAFDKDARDMYWKQAYEGLFKYGIDGWWCDSSEPYDAIWHGMERPPLPERMKLSVGEFKKYIDDGKINAYSLEHSRGMYENQRKCSDKRMINLTRSGYSGQHRYGTVVWSGDVSATWEALARQIRIIQNYVACGEAYWNSDVGGFFVRNGYEWFRDGNYPDGVGDLGFRELYTRWLQFACFTPMFRSHGTDTPREVWRFGERGEMFRDAIEKTIKLRYELMPYFYSVNAAVTFDGTMPVTPLALAYPADCEAHKVTDEYMYGHELLVCPVTRPMYYGPGSAPMENADKTMWVYLPDGGWYDYYTEKYYDGGNYYRIECSADSIPLFVRAGSVIPTASGLMSSEDMTGADYEVRVYTGADGDFTVYDDAGDGYAYENGEYTKVKVIYDEKSGNITEECTGCELFRHNMTFRKIKQS